MSRDVMQQAFDALRTCSWSRETEDAITALSEELAKPERQPLTDAMVQESKMLDDYNERGIFIDGWLKAEAAHEIKEKV